MSNDLALFGGDPVRKVPFNLEQTQMSDSEESAILDVIRSRRLSQFSNTSVKEFEQAFAQYIGVKYATMVTSGTAALHLALNSVKIGPGDEVLIPAITYIATANAVMMQNASPVFVDIDLTTYNLNISQLENYLTDNTKAIILVDLFGNPVHREKIMEFCQNNNLFLIEDCAHSIGADFHGKKVGAFGIGCFSFTESKNLVTGEGGMITTNDGNIYQMTRIFRHEGEVWRGHNISAADMRISTFNEFINGRDVTTIGYNYRPTAMQSALGLMQLKKIEQITRNRAERANRYIAFLKEFPEIKLPQILQNCTHSYNRFVFQLDQEAIGLSRNAFLMALISEGIPAGIYRNCPLPDYTVFQKLSGFGSTSCPFSCQRENHSIKYESNLLKNSVIFCETNIQIPVYPGLNLHDEKDILSSIEKVILVARENKELDRQIMEKVKESKIAKYTGEYIFDFEKTN